MYKLKDLLGDGADRLRVYTQLFQIDEDRVTIEPTRASIEVEGRRFPLFAFDATPIDPADFNELAGVIPAPDAQNLLDFVKRVAALAEFREHPTARLATAMAKEVEDLTQFSTQFAQHRSTALVLLAGILGLEDEQAMHLVMQAPPHKELREILTKLAESHNPALIQMHDGWLAGYTELTRLHDKSLETQAKAKEPEDANS